MKLESAHIEEVRGIRKLDLHFNRNTFAISGPNGSGKSGVVDAIEFGLTGQIGRLAGRGTKGLTVTEHGPHVDKTKFPDAAFVKLRVFFPQLNKTGTITRKLSAPRKPIIEPAEADVKAAFAEIEEHPEIALSRREILRFILVEPTKRSEEIQALLKLEEIGQTRASLNTAQNKCQTTAAVAAAGVRSTRQALQTHLQISTLRAEDLLEPVNKRRKVLGLTELIELTANTQLDLGLSAEARLESFNKQSALRDLKSFEDAEPSMANRAEAEADAIISSLVRLEAEPGLLIALQRRNFIEEGLELVSGPDCPLCDTPWDSEQHLLDHLREKLAKSEEAHVIQQALLDNGRKLAAEEVSIAGLISLVRKVAQDQGDSAFDRVLSEWKAELDEFRSKLTTIDGLTGLKGRLTAGWVNTPAKIRTALRGLRQKVEARPDPTATLEAQTFLTTAQVRLRDFRDALRTSKSAASAVKVANAAYKAYCEVMEEELNKLYDDVRDDFSKFYRTINEDDEFEFTAKLTPSAGRLDFDVNFYGRGLFPPAAYHSEGHQDGMGVCLYLALMRRLFGDELAFALLDDVVMSVDSGHRYRFCKLLKTAFPNTQFIITTHDRLWAEQMKSAGLVTAKTSVAFHSWNIDTGPLVESNAEIWDEIAAALAKGKVENAAAALRHHLEYVSRHLADQLAATPVFRADGNYDLGDLLPAVLSRMKTWYGKAAKAAQSWGNEEQKQDATARKDRLSISNGAANVERWAVNKAVHYNEWANFERRDFEPVVTAFRELLETFRCEKCESWLYVTPRNAPDTLRCSCNAVSLNLTEKS
jgi:recombinational DNA repair ATPase RecF